MNQVTQWPAIILQMKSPPAKGQAKGVNRSGPHKHYNYEEDLIWSIHNTSILLATKLEIMP